jgi:hypothetical protein
VPRPPRQLHGRPALVAAAAAALLISLFAPWYHETIVARGVTGLRTMSVTRSGWDAFGFTGAVVVIVAVVALAMVAAAPIAAARTGHRRRRLSGALVTVLSAIACVVVLVRLATAAGTTHHALAVTTVSTRWGIYLALAAGALLTVAGVRLWRTPVPERAPTRAARKARPPRPAQPPRPARPPAVARRAERPRPARPRWEDSWLDAPD